MKDASIRLNELNHEYKIACRNIRKANKGLPHPVSINKNYRLYPHDNFITMQIDYTDGDGKPEIYNIAI